MKYFEYVDFKSIPDELIESFNQIINKPTQSALKKDYPLKYYPWLVIKPVKDDLKQFLESLFPFEVFISYQLVYNGLTIHKDTHRLYHYLYLIELGGDEVYTNFYNDQKILIESTIFPLKQWVKLDAQTFHNVTGIPNNNVRAAVVVTPKSCLITPNINTAL